MADDRRRHAGHMDGMSGMSGMDMSMGPFTAVNMSIAKGYWGAIAGIVGLLTIIRIISIIQARHRRSLADHSQVVPSRPQNVITQAYATATATAREMTYSQPTYFTGRVSKYFTPLPVGQWLTLAAYWIMLLAFLWSGTIMKKNDPMYAYKWEKVGFRAAWVSVAQIPFIYLLSCKFNPISLLTGISYERFNWLHRWAARTVFLTVIVHWSFFFKEWTLSQMVSMQLEMMPMVKYGFGAWAVIGWMILSGFGFFRQMNYELFVAQHICAAAVLLWLLFVHVPGYAKWAIYLSIGFVAFDWVARIVFNVLRNTHLLAKPSLRAPGYSARLETLPGDMVRLTIDDVDFSWKSGQHAFLSMPKLRPLELHPFTIANASQPSGNGPRQFSMVIKAHSGFSKSLHNAATKGNTESTHRAFISGPWGTPPDLLHYETVVLIACSSGASFITPLLEDLVVKRGCVRKVSLHWIIRSNDHFQWFGQTLSKLIETAKKSGLSLQVTVHVTSSERPGDISAERVDSRADSMLKVTTETDASSMEGSMSELSTASTTEDLKAPVSSLRERRPVTCLTTKYGGRPSVESMIRAPVEAAFGETAVVVCGGVPITAEVRTYVAKLSDERAVHKGTGAQGIFMFAESFGW